MNQLLPDLISWLQLYGYPALWLSVCIAAIGAPLPISLVLLAMGAFAALGDFNLLLLLLVSTSASICGDSIGYWIGRKVGPPLLAWLSTTQKLRFITPKTIKRGEDYFRRRAGFAVFASRCIVPSLGGTINILAGAEHYSYRNFLVLDVCGEAIGAIIPLMLGFVFGASWEAIGSLLSQISTLILILFIAVYLIVLLIGTLRKIRVNQERNATVTQGLAQEEVLLSSDSASSTTPPLPRTHNQHKRRKVRKNSKKGLFPATLRRLQTYKSTDGLHTGYGFPKETMSNPGHRD